MATGQVHDGEAQVREYFRETRTAFPDQRNELISLRHADDAVIAEFWLLGTHRGPLKGIPATGKAFRVRMTALRWAPEAPFTTTYVARGAQNCYKARPFHTPENRPGRGQGIPGFRYVASLSGHRQGSDGG